MTQKTPRNHPKITFVIASYNNKQLLVRLLKSIKTQLKSSSLEVIIADDHSTDGTPEIIQKNFSEYQLLTSSQNLGFSKNNNRAIAKVTTKYTVLLGQDVYFQQNFLPPIITFLRKHPKVGALTPRLLYPNGDHQFNYRSFPSLRNLFWQTFVDLKLLPNNHIFGKYKLTYLKQNQINIIPQIDASCSVYRTDILKKLRSFDQQFPSYFNDVDLCYRINKLGYNIVYFPKVTVYHDHGQSFGKMQTNKRLKNWNQGVKKFHLKHLTKSKLSFDYIVLSLLLLLRSLVIKISGLHQKKY